MQFSHRNDPNRTATLSQKGDEPVFVVAHVDAAGKSRKKSFRKPTLWQARDAAVRFLLNKEGYILRSPQDGPIQWMARLLLDGYRGEIGHAVDPTTGVVWVHDAEDKVHRITPKTCETTTVALRSGNQSPGASIIAANNGDAWCIAPNWNRTADGLIRHYRLYRIHGETPSTELVADLIGPELIGHLSATTDGRILAPAEGGAAIYGPGGIERRFTCTPRDEGQPVAAISTNGEWVVTSQPNSMTREHLPNGSQAQLRADEFKGFNSVQIADDGTVYASGFRYPSHGLWRLTEDEPQRVSEDIRATVRADGRQLVEVRYGRITLCDPTQPSEDEMKLSHVLAELEVPVLGMAKYGRAAFGPDGSLAVLTDAYTVAEVARQAR